MDQVKTAADSEWFEPAFSRFKKIYVLRAMLKVGAPLALVCSIFGVSPSTARAWRRKFIVKGWDALWDRRRGPRRKKVAATAPAGQETDHAIA